jgi:AcrR family transcriptional regulator
MTDRSTIDPPLDSDPDGLPLRRRLAPDERRELLLGAAIDLFTDAPYAEVSISAIARHAGVSKSLVFRYFEDKRALYLEAVERVLGEVLIVSDPGSGLPLDERVRAALDGYLALIERHPRGFDHFALGDMSRDPDVRALLDRARDARAALLFERLGVTEPPALLRFAVFSFFRYVSTAMADWVEDPAISRDELLDLLRATLLATLAHALGAGAGAGTGADAADPR